MNNIKRYANFESRIVNIQYIIEYRNFILPPSQREKEWVNEQNSKFILSILENKPLGSLILNKKNNKTYILDGQHRINALELFISDKIGVLHNNEYIFYNGKSNIALKAQEKYNIITLDEDEKRDFNETEIFIREYNDLTDNEMADIIDSINEGIKNDNINADNTNINIVNTFINEISILIYNINYNDLTENKKNYIIKCIGYIGTIIDNIETYDTDNDYIQLNSHHVKRYINNLKKNPDINKIDNIKIFLRILYSQSLMNNNKIIEMIDENGLNNYSFNCICYKIYNLYKNNLLTGNEENIRNVIIEVIKNKTNFKESINLFNQKY